MLTTKSFNNLFLFEIEVSNWSLFFDKSTCKILEAAILNDLISIASLITITPEDKWANTVSRYDRADSSLI